MTTESINSIIITQNSFP